MKHYIAVAKYPSEGSGVVYSGSDEKEALGALRGTTGSYELRTYTKKARFINLNVQEFWHGNKFSTDVNHAISLRDLEAMVLMQEKNLKKKKSVTDVFS